MRNKSSCLQWLRLGMVGYWRATQVLVLDSGAFSIRYEIIQVRKILLVDLEPPSFLLLTKQLVSLPISALLLLPSNTLSLVLPRAPHTSDLRLGAASSQSFFLASFPTPPAPYHHSHHAFLSFTQHITACNDLIYCLSLGF